MLQKFTKDVLTLTVTLYPGLQSSSGGKSEGINKVLASQVNATSNLFNKLTM